jgi:deoxycytidine triphosphate deaminase
MLSDNQIDKLIRIGKIKIVPYWPDRLGPVSYDLHTHVDGSDKTEMLVYGSEQWVMTESIKNLPRLIKLVTTEEIQLSPGYVGTAMCRSRSELRGLITSFSPLVDPGYKGHLIFLVLDTIGNCIRVDDLFQITFDKVYGDVARPYNKRKGSNAMGRTGFETTS